MLHSFFIPFTFATVLMSAPTTGPTTAPSTQPAAANPTQFTLGMEFNNIDSSALYKLLLVTPVEEVMHVPIEFTGHIHPPMPPPRKVQVKTWATSDQTFSLRCESFSNNFNCRANIKMVKEGQATVAAPDQNDPALHVTIHHPAAQDFYNKLDIKPMTIAANESIKMFLSSDLKATLLCSEANELQATLDSCDLRMDIPR